MDNEVLTLCIYEHPAALSDIERWKEIFKPYIKEYSTLWDSHRFILQKIDYVEYVICIPKYEIEKSFHNLQSYIQSICKYKILKYNKTILVGKFTSLELYYIAEFISRYEKNIDENV